MNPWAVTVSRLRDDRLYIEIPVLDIVTEANVLGDVEVAARECISMATSEPPDNFNLDITWAVSAPNRLKNIRNQLKLRHYVVGEIEIRSGNWAFPIEWGPDQTPIDVWVADVGGDSPDRDVWLPKNLRWTTNKNGYDGQGLESPTHLADRIIETIAGDQK